jgi:uncharacterized protein
MSGRDAAKEHLMGEATFAAGEVDLDALDRFLASDASPEHCMQVSDLDGFLTGIAIGPEPVPPSEWLPEVWGGEEPVFADAEQARSVIGTIMGRYNEVLRELDTDPEAYAPILWEGPDGEDIAGDWAEGFVDAIRLRPEAWRPLLEDREALVLLMPILALCGDEEGGSPLELDAEAEAELVAEAPALIPAWVAGIAALWRECHGRSVAGGGFRGRRRWAPRRPVPLGFWSQARALLGLSLDSFTSFTALGRERRMRATARGDRRMSANWVGPRLDCHCYHRFFIAGGASIERPSSSGETGSAKRARGGALRPSFHPRRPGRRL